MDINAHIKASQSRNFHTIYQEGIKHKNLGKDPVSFRLLPAFDPDNPDKGTSYLPCIMPDGSFSSWGNMMVVSRFVGRVNKVDIVSPRTFDADAFCPMSYLYTAIRKDPDWMYLFKGESFRDTPLDRPNRVLVANIVDVNSPGIGTQVAVMGFMAMSCLIADDGLMRQPNTMVGVEEAMKVDYMAEYANGDITHPETGLILLFSSARVDGKSTHNIALSRPVRRIPVDRSLMEGRVDLSNMRNVVKESSPEEIVQTLVEKLTSRNAAGMHEHYILREVFPQFSIPAPVSAPGALSTVPSGFQPSAALEDVGGVAGAGHTELATVTPPAQSTPVQKVKRSNPTALNAPGVSEHEDEAEPAVLSANPPAAPTTDAHPAVLSMHGAVPPAQDPVTPPAAPETTPQTGTAAASPAASGTATQAALPTAPGPTVPGDNVPLPDFLAKFRAEAQAAKSQT